MRAPFPYFGSKSAIAAQVWELLGDPAVYVEPFAGSLAVLLGRPPTRRTATVHEIIGDADHFVANFWRACTTAPDQVAAAAVQPMYEINLVATGRWLDTIGRARLERLGDDPDLCDPVVAGRWAWAQCTAHNPGTWRRMTSGRKGVNRDTDITAEMTALATRLNRVQVYAGDWERSVRGPQWRGDLAVFLDPPYRMIDRAVVYDHEVTADLHTRIETWAAQIPATWRVVIAGYDGDFTLPGWRMLTPSFASARPAGQTRAAANLERERLWTNVHPDGDSLFG